MTAEETSFAARAVALWVRVRTISKIALIAIFAVVATFPGQALAFTEHTTLSGSALVFYFDSTLEGQAISGAEAEARFGRRTVGSLLRSGYLSVRQTPQPGSTVRILATSYSSSFDQTDANPYVTASGEPVGEDVVATNFLPLGTEVKIGTHTYTVLDRMNSRYDNTYIVDVWMPSREAALLFGTHFVDMEIISVPTEQ